jgi:glycosyltransferase involved in cell wall biosynthesis
VVHIVVPDGIDDPHRPSGGNIYDRMVCDALAGRGWTVRLLQVTGGWPEPDAATRGVLAGTIAQLPDGGVVLVDGLIGSAAADELVPAARRLRLVILVHMPLGAPSGDDSARQRERAVLTAAAAVITTSDWTRRALIGSYGLPADKVRVATPGVEPAEPAAGTATGGNLLCVAAVTPNKGHDTLLGALTLAAALPWRCSCIGSLTRDPEYADRLRGQAAVAGISGRVWFPGSQTGRDLDLAYAATDVLLLASRTETYGMVITEALARGIPVICTDVGGTREAVGRAPDGTRPGLLVPAADPAAFGDALRRWLTDAALRARLRRAALDRRATLTGWSVTSDLISRVLTAVIG